MPEEHNRVVTDHLADLLCAPTESSRENLAREGIEGDQVVVTGNTVVEAVNGLLPTPDSRAATLGEFNLRPGQFVLATFHRPENVDDRATWASILEALANLELPVVLPLHPRSAARAASFGLGSLLERVQVVDPIGYRAFLGLMAESAYLVSDSGGVQEEVSVVKRPVVIVRRSTERPEVIGTFARLVSPNGIMPVVRNWLSEPSTIHRRLANLPSPYGDGTASRRSVDAINRLIEVRRP
jgi:UDP-N-acetylglucosamine 2-epimerase (non-hydrolysing)